MTAQRESPLRTHLAALGWSPEQLIARINEVRRRRGAAALHPKSAYKWVQGHRPSAAVSADIITVLRLHRGVRLTPADLGWDKPAQRSHAFDDLYTLSAGELLASQGDDMERRRFVLLTGSSVTACALDLLLPGADGLRPALDGDRVSTTLLADIEASVRRSRELDDTEGSRPALLWAGGLWRLLGQIVTRCSYGDTEGRHLHRLYIEMSETYGWMLFDAAQHARAQRVYLTGLRVAREASTDPALQHATANLLASTAYQESWLGHHTEAATLIAIASTRSEALPSRVGAVIAQREITIAGRRGDVDAVGRASARAHELLDNARRGDQPWWSQWLTPAAIDGATGRAWLALHHPDHAAAHLTQRATTANSAYPRDRLLALCDLATARLHAGDPVAACEPLDHALDLTRTVDSPRVAAYLHDAVTQLRDTRCRHVQARDVMMKAADSTRT